MEDKFKNGIKSEPRHGTRTRGILEYMESGKSITPKDALRKFGCFRLAVIIFNLKAAGFDIDTEIVREGKTRYARYTLLTNNKKV